MEPRVADRFEIERLAGKGGMGTVFRALDHATGKPVALKLLDDPDLVARFEREAAVLASIRHPAVVGYVAHGEIAPGRMYLAMNWLDGVALHQRLKRCRLSVAETFALGQRLARALGAAHAGGIVHRDVKPSNVILEDDDPAKAVLVDFGIARAQLGSTTVTATGAIIGTPAYMAPEQARGERDVDAPADVFSLGSVLFESVCGRAPFVGEHAIAVLAKILLEQAPRARTVRADVPVPLDDLLAQMLEKAPPARPPDGSAVAAALDAIASGNAPERAARAPAIGQKERRMATVVLARAATTRSSTMDSLAGITSESLLTDAASAAGVTITPLADGTFAGAVVGEGAGADAAIRAARCAVALGARAPEGVVCVATGRAIVAGDVPVGEAIDRAARLLAADRNPGAFVDDATAALVEDRFELVRDGDDASRIVRERDPADRSRTVLGRVVPFVGRDRELGALEAMFSECVDEPVARAVVVVAPPGTGKTRLRAELVKRVTQRDAPPEVWLGLSDPLMERDAHALVSDVIRRTAGIAADEPLASRRKKLAARMGERVASILGEIAGAPFDDERDAVLRAARRSPELLAEHVGRAFLAFVKSELAKRPLLVVLEDVHWADASSLRLFDVVLQEARDLPLMVLALARPAIDTAHPKLWEAARSQRIVLEPLLRKASEKLARAVLGDRPEIDAIVQRAAGNALFVEELARACAEGRSPAELPPNVAAATEARLAAIDADARKVLRAAAIFGERFWGGGVARLIGADGDVPPRSTLAALERLEVISSEPASRFAGENEYFFRHALVRDAAYAMLTEEDRALGHALAGSWLEGRLDDGALLAQHYEKGGRAADAARCYVRAAEQALAANDLDAALRHVARVDAGAAPAVIGLGSLVEAEVAFLRAANADAVRAARRAIDSIERGSEKWFAAMGLGVAAAGKGGDHASLDALVGALEATPARDAKAGPARAIARARAAMQMAYSYEIARCDALLDGCEREPGAANDVGVLAWLDEAATERGNAAGEPVHPSIPRRGYARFLEVGDPRGATGQRASEAQLLATIGAEEESLAVCDALEREAAHSRYVVLYVRSIRAVVAAFRGDVGPMRAFIEELSAGVTSRAMWNFTGVFAQLAMKAGNIDEAETYGRRCAAYRDADSGYLATAHAVLARVAVARGDAATALAESARGLELLARGALSSTIGLAHLARLEALTLAGRRDDAVAAARKGMEALAWSSRHLAEYRAVFYRSWDTGTFVEAARAYGVEVEPALG
jgi:hypothetical protein